MPKEAYKKHTTLKTTTGDAAVKGVINYLKNRGKSEIEAHQIAINYSNLIDITLACNRIQEDFGAFIQYLKTNKL